MEDKLKNAMSQQLAQQAIEIANLKIDLIMAQYQIEELKGANADADIIE